MSTLCNFCLDFDDSYLLDTLLTLALSNLSSWREAPFRNLAKGSCCQCLLETMISSALTFSVGNCKCPSKTTLPTPKCWSSLPPGCAYSSWLTFSCHQLLETPHELCCGENLSTFTETGFKVGHLLCELSIWRFKTSKVGAEKTVGDSHFSMSFAEILENSEQLHCWYLLPPDKSYFCKVP